MFSRDFARGPTWPVHPTVDLALNFHKKIPLFVPSSLNISEGGSLLSFCTVLDCAGKALEKRNYKNWFIPS